jgi:hypothetical protein
VGVSGPGTGERERDPGGSPAQVIPQIDGLDVASLWEPALVVRTLKVTRVSRRILAPNGELWLETGYLSLTGTALTQ